MRELYVFHTRYRGTPPNLGASVTTYTDGGLLQGVFYGYRVKAVNGPLALAYAPEANIVINPAPAPPPVITSISPTSGSPGTAVTIRGFYLVSPLTVQFGGSSGVVASSSSNADGSLWAIVPGGAMTGTVAVMTNGGTAESGAIFTVTGSGGGGGNGGVPQAPSNLSATPGSLEIDLQWNDNSNNETGFKVERRIVPTTIWTELTSLPPNTTRYLDGGLAPNFSYVYRVQAFTADGNSGYSNEAGGRPNSF